MNGLEALPEPAHRVLLGAVVVYVALVVVDLATGVTLAFVASQVLLGVIAIGVGALLVRRAGGEQSPVLAAGVALAVGGAAQLAWLLTGVALFDALATTGVVVGIGLYIFGVWIVD